MIKKYKSCHYKAMGATINLQTYGTQSNDIIDQSVKLINHYEKLLTVNRNQSEIMSINHAAGKNKVQVSSGTYSLVKLAVNISKEGFGFNALNRSYCKIMAYWLS